jgi:hypothetical protein
MTWEEYVARMLEIRNKYRVLVGKLEGKRFILKHKPDWWIVIKYILKT